MKTMKVFYIVIACLLWVGYSTCKKYKIQQTNFFLLIFLFFLFSASCKKKEIRRIDSPLLREAITFKDGSYFVYRDSISGDIDSFWVDGFELYNSGVEHSLTIEKGVYLMYHADSTKKFTFRTDGEDFRGIEFMRGKFVLDNNNQWDFTSLTNPHVSNDVLKCIFLGHFETYAINGVNYPEVYVYASIDSLNYAQSYYSSTHGLVKLEIKNNNVHVVYELLKQKVIK